MRTNAAYKKDSATDADAADRLAAQPDGRDHGAGGVVPKERALAGGLPELVVWIGKVLRTRPVYSSTNSVEKGHRRSTEALGDLRGELLWHRLGRPDQENRTAQGVKPLHFTLGIQGLLGPPSGLH